MYIWSLWAVLTEISTDWKNYINVWRSLHKFSLNTGNEFLTKAFHIHKTLTEELLS